MQIPPTKERYFENQCTKEMIWRGLLRLDVHMPVRGHPATTSRGLILCTLRRMEKKVVTRINDHVVFLTNYLTNYLMSRFCIQLSRIIKIDLDF